MKATVERKPQSEVVLNVDIEWSEIESASNQAAKKLSEKYAVPGFRRGHAPRSVLERMLGKEAIYEEALDILISKTYAEALRENKLVPLTQPELNTPTFETGKDYQFSATVPVLSTPVLGEYGSLHFEAESLEVQDEEITKVLEELQQQNALWLPAERPAQIGDKVTADLLLTVGDRTISNLKDNEFELVNEREGLFVGLDQNIVEMSEGEQKDFTAAIPESYTNQDLAGKEAQYHIEIKSIKFKEVPAIDDELAKSLGDFVTVDDLKKAVREQLLSTKTRKAQQELQEKILDAVTEQATVDIHPKLIEDEINAIIAETQQYLSQNNLGFEDFLKFSNKTYEQYREELKPDAEKRIKRELVLEAVAEKELITVTDQEVRAIIELYAQLGDPSAKNTKLKPEQKQRLASQIRRDKTVQRLQQIIAPEAASAATAEENAKAAAQETHNEETEKAEV